MDARKVVPVVGSRGDGGKRQAGNLDTETGLAPMSPLGVVSDGVASPEANPLGDRAVLLLRLGELLLRAESLVARHFDDVVDEIRYVVFWREK